MATEVHIHILEFFPYACLYPNLLKKKKKDKTYLFNFWPHPEACGISVPCPGIKLAFLALKGRVLTTGPL